MSTKCFQYGTPLFWATPEFDIEKPVEEEFDGRNGIYLAANEPYFVETKFYDWYLKYGVTKIKVLVFMLIRNIIQFKKNTNANRISFQDLCEKHRYAEVEPSSESYELFLSPSTFNYSARPLGSYELTLDDLIERYGYTAQFYNEAITKYA